ncbi:MAG: hypothetical protein ACK4Z8_09170 [Novosphingobium sp.]
MPVHVEIAAFATKQFVDSEKAGLPGLQVRKRQMVLYEIPVERWRPADRAQHKVGMRTDDLGAVCVRAVGGKVAQRRAEYPNWRTVSGHSDRDIVAPGEFDELLWPAAIGEQGRGGALDLSKHHAPVVSQDGKARRCKQGDFGANVMALEIGRCQARFRTGQQISRLSCPDEQEVAFRVHSARIG